MGWFIRASAIWLSAHRAQRYRWCGELEKLGRARRWWRYERDLRPVVIGDATIRLIGAATVAAAGGIMVFGTPAAVSALAPWAPPPLALCLTYFGCGIQIGAVWRTLPEIGKMLQG